MMFHRLRFLNKNQLGFTLIELMLAIAISGVITGAVTTTIYQVVTGNLRTSNHMTAVRQVQEAGYWVSRDTLMAQTVVLARDSDGFPLNLSWTQWDGTVNEVTYTIVDDELRRARSTNGGVPSETTAAKFIDPDSAKTKCELIGGGTFTLPDNGDTFVITGGPLADSGIITVVSGSISVTVADGATYNGSTGAWTTPAAGGTVSVRATADKTVGAWTSTTISAGVAITQDTDEDATITGGVLVFTVTATVGNGSQEQGETRIYKIVPRPGS